jgi:hypothetical protein
VTDAVTMSWQQTGNSSRRIETLEVGGQFLGQGKAEQVEVGRKEGALHTPQAVCTLYAGMGIPLYGGRLLAALVQTALAPRP